MPIGQNLGMRAKVEPEADSRATRQMVRDLEKEIEEVESLQFSSDGFQGRTSPSGGGGGGMGGGAVGGAGLAAKSKGLSLGGMAKGAGAIGAVALAGTLATRMLGAMQKASGQLQASTYILGTAMDLFFKPFGDFLGKWLRPLSKSLIEMATGFNKNVEEWGLLPGLFKSQADLVNNLPVEIGKVFIRTLGQELESLLGGNQLFTAMKEFEWSDWIPIVKWDDFVGGAFDMVTGEWPGYPNIIGHWPMMLG